MIDSATVRGVYLVGNFFLGGRWETAFGSKLLTRKTGCIETSDTVEDKNKNVITGHAAETEAYMRHIWGGGHDVLPSPVPHFGGTCPPCPPRDLRPWLLLMPSTSRMGYGEHKPTKSASSWTNSSAWPYRPHWIWRSFFGIHVGAAAPG